MSPPSTTRRRRLARRLWPIALLLLALPAVASMVLIDTYDASTATLLALVVAPNLLAVGYTAYAIGGRRGALTGAGLLGLIAYWAWWFTWQIDGQSSPFSFGLAAEGLADAAVYHLALALLLWPIVLAGAVLVAVVARRRGWPIWPALGVAVLVATVLAFPSRAAWDDTCNGLDGASPLLTRPIAQPLMDHGVGVIPGGFQTAMYCSAVGDREWKPFWLGDDELPPEPSVYPGIHESVRMPRRLAPTPVPLRPGAFEHVAIARSMRGLGFLAVVRVDRKLPVSPVGGQQWDFRLGHHLQGQAEEQRLTGGRGYCYRLNWRLGRNEGVPITRAGGRIRMRLTYEAAGRELAGKTVVMTTLPADLGEHSRALKRLIRRFGCG